MRVQAGPELSHTFGTMTATSWKDDALACGEGLGGYLREPEPRDAVVGCSVERKPHPAELGRQRDIASVVSAQAALVCKTGGPPGEPVVRPHTAQAEPYESPVCPTGVSRLTHPSAKHGQHLVEEKFWNDEACWVSDDVS